MPHSFCTRAYFLSRTHNIQEVFKEEGELIKWESKNEKLIGVRMNLITQRLLILLLFHIQPSAACHNNLFCRIKNYLEWVKDSQEWLMNDYWIFMSINPFDWIKCSATQRSNSQTLAPTPPIINSLHLYSPWTFSSYSSNTMITVMV